VARVQERAVLPLLARAAGRAGRAWALPGTTNGGTWRSARCARQPRPRCQARHSAWSRRGRIWSWWAC